MQLLTKLCLSAALALFGQAALALDFRSAAAHGVILYDTPSDQGRKVFVISKGTPLELLAEQGLWMRVRDQGGSLAWVHKQDMSLVRTLQVVKPSTVYREANTTSAPVFRASPGLLLNQLENTRSGWIKVKHRDGAIGFIRIEDVWGL